MYVTIICAVLLILVATLILRQVNRYRVLNTISGPSSLEVLKFFLIPKSNEEVTRYITSLPEKYGLVVKLWIKPLTPALFISDRKFVKYILGSKDHLQKTTFYDLFIDIIGCGLFSNSDVSAWRSDKKLLGPMFNHLAVSQYSSKFKQHILKLKRIIEAHENKVIDITPHMQKFVIDVIIEYLTGQDVSNRQNFSKQFVEPWDDYFSMIYERTFSLYMRNNTIFKLTKKYKIWKRSCDIVHKLVSYLHEKQIFLSASKKDENKKQVIDLLMDCGASQYSIISHIATFIIGGFETVSRTATFALFEIAQRPDVQDRIYNECVSIAEKNGTEDITFEDLKNMVYIESVIKETLRIYPPVPFIERKLMTPITIGGIEIPSGVNLIFSIINLHRSSEFDRPMEFNPDRFLPENSNNIPSYQYIPFSIGPRDCIGRKVGMAEMKFLIFYIVRHFTLHPMQPKHKLDLTIEFTLKSKKEVPVIFRKRVQEKGVN